MMAEKNQSSDNVIQNMFQQKNFNGTNMSH